MEEMASVQWILKGKDIGMVPSLLEIADLTNDFGDKKVENELTKSLFSTTVHVLSVWRACNSY